MRKLIIGIIASCMIIFVIWAFMILIRYNFNVQGVRFSLQRTFQQISNINEQNFIDLINNIKNVISTYNITMSSYQNMENPFMQFFGGLDITALFLASIIQVLIEVFKYILAVLQMFFQIIGFMFNPVTY